MALQTKTVSTGDYAWKSWSNGYVIALTLTEESVDAAQNTSRISYVFKISNTCNNRFYSYDYSWNISIGGQNIAINNFNFDLSSDYTTQVMASGTITVQHNDDGGLEMPYAVSIPNVQYWNSYGPPAMELTGTWTLTKIPRASTIGATDANIGAISMVVVGKKSDSFTHSVQYGFGALSGFLNADGSTTQTEVRFGNTSIPFLVPEEFYRQIPDAPSGVCTLICRTYSGSTQVGQEQTAVFTATANLDACRPAVAGTVVDTNKVTVALTGDSTKLIRFCSIARCTITAEAKKGAAIQQKKIDGVAVSQSRSIPEVENPEFLFWARDSRGYETAQTVKTEMIPYVKLTCNPTGSRTEPTGGEVLLTVRGNFFAGNFGAQQNTLQLRYRVGSGEFVKVPPVLDGNTYTAAAVIPELDYRKNHTIEVVAEDKLGTLTKPVVIRSGIPVFDWGERDFAFHVPVTAPRFNSVDGAAVIRVKDTENADALKLKTQFRDFAGTDVSRQSLLLFGSNNALPVWGMLTVDGSGAAAWSGTGDLAFSTADNGCVILQLPETGSDRFVSISGQVHYLWDKDAVYEAFAVLGSGVLGTMILGKDF